MLGFPTWSLLKEEEDHFRRVQIQVLSSYDVKALFIGSAPKDSNKLLKSFSRFRTESYYRRHVFTMLMDINPTMAQALSCRFRDPASYIVSALWQFTLETNPSRL